MAALPCHMTDQESCNAQAEEGTNHRVGYQHLPYVHVRIIAWRQCGLILNLDYMTQDPAPPPQLFPVQSLLSLQ